MGKEDLQFLTGYDGPAFTAYSVPHILALVSIAAAAALAAFFGARASQRNRRIGAMVLALLWGGLELYWTITSLDTCERTRDCLPLHLCDISAILTVVALATHRQIPFEFIYFFGLGGTLQALFTPDLPFGFPSESFFRFFVSHGGVIVAVAYLIAGFRLRPKPVSVVRTIAIGYGYLVAISLFNWLLGTNYVYTCSKPASATLFDKLGPWPWYVIFASFIAVVNILILYLPYWWLDRRAKRLRPDIE